MKDEAELIDLRRRSGIRYFAWNICCSIGGFTLMRKVLLGIAVLGTVVAGGVAVDTVTAADARAASCWGQITASKGKNYSGCGKARHFNRLANSTMKWGSVANTNSWSYEQACWANIAQYGMVRA